jgi:hypothetical protein
MMTYDRIWRAGNEASVWVFSVYDRISSAGSFFFFFLIGLFRPSVSYETFT